MTVNGKVDKSALSLKPMDELPLVLKTKTGVKASEVKPKKTLESICELILIHFGVAVSPEKSLSDYGFNSLHYTKLSQLLFNELGISILPHQFYHSNKLSSLINRDNAFAMNCSIDSEDKPSPIQRKIAVIGYDGLLPGGLDPQGFWNSLVSGEAFISKNTRPYLNSDLWAGFIPEIETFDRRFFKISPLEAKLVDPRQRLLLQCAWRTLEQAGKAMTSEAPLAIGCYIAATGQDYLYAQIKEAEEQHPYRLSGSAVTMLANRISYFFDWQGPSMTIDTACSSSLVAINRACDALRLNQCEMAFVGGVNLLLDDEITSSLDAGHFLSPNHHCATFSAQADGYVRGEGVVGLLLKPYDKACEEGDYIMRLLNRMLIIMVDMLNH